MPKNHAKAQELLRQNKSRNKESEGASGSSKDNTEDVHETDETDSEEDEPTPIAPLSPLDTSLIDEDMEQNLEFLASAARTVAVASSASSAISTAAASIAETVQAASTCTTAENRGAAATVQSTVTSFFQTSGKLPEGPDNAIARIEDGINKILIRMDAMDVNEKSAQPHVECSIESVGAADVKAAINLVDLANCRQVRVETLEDGCRVTCIPCYEYIRATPLMKT